MKPRALILTLLTVAATPALLATEAQAKVVVLTHDSTKDYGDPSRPQFEEGGKVTLTTTGGFLLTWQSPKDFFEGVSPTSELLRICHADGTPLSEEYGEDIWDPILDGDTLTGSVMSPVGKNENAHWPDDAFSRRTFEFHLKDQCWTRDEEPLWPSSGVGWIDHTYGHDKLENVLFYEKVTSVRNGEPHSTDLFARQNGREIKIFEAGRWPSARRESGSRLVEGPRPFKIGQTYFIAFSAGDYFSETYGIHLLTSKSLTGPYKPILNTQKTDLKNFSFLIENEVPLTWGAGRAAFFEYKKQWWMIAHGIQEPFAGPDGHRQLFLTPIDPNELRSSSKPIATYGNSRYLMSTDGQEACDDDLHH